MREIKNKRKKVPSVIFQEKKTRSKTENKLICSRFFFFFKGETLAHVKVVVFQ
jgi:hypothetical protein